MTHMVLFFYIAAMFKVLDKFTNFETRMMVGGIEYMNLGNDILNTIVVIFIITVVIYMSSLTYKYIELKGQELNKKWFRHILFLLCESILSLVLFNGLVLVGVWFRLLCFNITGYFGLRYVVDHYNNTIINRKNHDYKT